jgi:hypothetical protein
MVTPLTQSYVKAYCLGFMFGLGVKARQTMLTKDENIPDKDLIFRTAKNGKKIAINTKTKEVSGVGATQLTDRQIKARVRYHEALLDELSKQSPKAKAIISSIKLTTEKDNVLPPVPHSTLKALGIKQSKKVVFKKDALQANQQRHLEIDPKSYPVLVGLCLYGKGQQILSSNVENYLRFKVPFGNNHHNEMILDIRETKENFEVVHVEQQRRRIEKTVAGVRPTHHPGSRNKS